MKILLSGKNGHVGWALGRILLRLGEIIALGRNEADLSRQESLRSVLRESKTDVIINAAAYMAVLKAEEGVVLTITINGTASSIIAEEVGKLYALLIHYSTVYVFDGTESEFYIVDAIPNPINAYGSSKLAGDNVIVQSGCDLLISRTSWECAERGRNFIMTMLRLMQVSDELRFVADHYGEPTKVRNISDATAQVLATSQQEQQAGGCRSNIYHLSASRNATWRGFTSALLERARQLVSTRDIKTERVLPVSTKEYPLSAPGPDNSRMDLSTLTARFGITLPAWHYAMKLCIDEVLEAQ